MEKNQKKRWVVPPRIPFQVEKELSEYPPIFRQILFNRGIPDSLSAKGFLECKQPEYDPFLLKDMSQAVETITEAVKGKKRILVFGDYDVDGVTATALLIQTIWRMGGMAIKYIPNRFKEGYGFSTEALEKVLELEPDLIITVDCGVRSINQINRVRQMGIKIIITDHHQPLENLPAANAIICPRQPGDNYPNSDLSGVGLAYKVAKALSFTGEFDNFEVSDMLDLVAVGTIADLAKLSPENRVLVRAGLDQINLRKRPGLSALCAVSGLETAKIQADHIGFILGPRLNAAGRLSSAEKAYQLLIAEDGNSAAKLALLLDQENRKRQEITRHILEEVETWMEKEGSGRIDLPLIFYSHEGFNEGVLGLAASRLAEMFYRPAIVGTIKDDLMRASCRSIPEVNITSTLDKCKELLLQHGGHAMAAGLTMETVQIDRFREKMSELLFEKISGLDLVPTIRAETEVNLLDLHPNLIPYLSMLEPTGVGNPAPLFISRNVQILYPKSVGKDGDHLKFMVQNAENSPDKQGKIRYDAIAFRFGHLKEVLSNSGKADILFSYEINHFNGNEKLQLNVRDIKIN